jgi:hypothetical protein
MSSRGLRPFSLALAGGVCLACGMGTDENRTPEPSYAAPVASAPASAFGPDGVPLDELSWSGWQYPDCEAGRLELMLDQYCTGCHVSSFSWVPIDCLGSDCLQRPDPVFFSELIAEGLVVPGDAQGSRIVVRVREASMPPASAGVRPALSAEQVAELASFIDGLDPAANKPDCDPDAASERLPP